MELAISQAIYHTTYKLSLWSLSFLSKYISEYAENDVLDALFLWKSQDDDRSSNSVIA